MVPLIRETSPLTNPGELSTTSKRSRNGLAGSDDQDSGRSVCKPYLTCLDKISVIPQIRKCGPNNVERAVWKCLKSAFRHYPPSFSIDNR